jgi:hypothetical protein
MSELSASAMVNWKSAILGAEFNTFKDEEWALSHCLHPANSKLNAESHQERAYCDESGVFPRMPLPVGCMTQPLTFRTGEIDG